MPRGKARPKKPLHKKYQEHLDTYPNRKDLSSKTLKLIEASLRTFPTDPQKLDADHFNRRGKDVSQATLRYEFGVACRFLKWAGIEQPSLDKKNGKFRLLKKEKTTVKITDLYRADELNKIWAALRESPRDLAMIRVLWELALRANELLSMTFENMRFWSEPVKYKDDEGKEQEREHEFASIIVSGKSGTRELLLEESVPGLRAWTNGHPTQKGPVWTSPRMGNTPITYAMVYYTVNTALRRAKITGKKKILHMFRHTRITQLYGAGFRGQELQSFAGWKSSAMETVYAHLSPADMINAYRTKVLGHGGVEKPKLQVVLTTCLKCQHNNPHGAVVCEKCNTELGVDRAKVQEILNSRKDLTDRITHQDQRIDRLEYLLYRSSTRSKDTVELDLGPELLEALKVTYGDKWRQKVHEDLFDFIIQHEDKDSSDPESIPKPEFTLKQLEAAMKKRASTVKEKEPSTDKKKRA